MRRKRQNVFLAFVGSLLLHGAALLLFALIVALSPPAPPETTPPDEPVRLEVAEDEPTPTPSPLLADAAKSTPTPTPRQILDATGEDSTETPSPSAAVSDRTTHASSAEAGDNRSPGAAQAGRKLASFQFDPRPPTSAVIDRVEDTAPTPLPQTAPALPQPDRFTPQTPPAFDSATPAPTATPAPSAADDEFALAMATPKPTPEDPFDPSVRSTSPPLPKPAAKNTPTPPVSSARSAENGGGGKRGTGGVETSQPPSARYGQQVSKIIKFIWSRSVESRQDLTYGSTVIHCLIDKDGLVLSPRVASNTSDTLFASTALQAVVVARLPPMPPDVVTELGGGRLSLDITFDLLVPQEAARR